MVVRYTIGYSKIAIRNIKDLDGSTKKSIKNAIDTKLMAYSEVFGKPLSYTLRGLRSMRVGSWRVIFTLKNNHIGIAAIRHRREVYDK